MNEIFCPLPWIHLATRNDGNLRLCAHANSSREYGLIRDHNDNICTVNHSEEDVRNSDFMKSVRKEFLRGQFPSSCVRCEKELRSGVRARPVYEAENWKDFINLDLARELTEDDGSIDINELPLIHMDLRMGNLCNLACRTCNPLESTSWYKDHLEVWGKKLNGPGYQCTLEKKGQHVEINGVKMDWAQKEEIPEIIRNGLSRVESIYFSGGEPLLLMGHHKILQHLIDIGRAPSVTLDYITNGTVISENLLQMWSHFKEIKIGLSVDGYGPVNEYIRHRSKWHQIERFLTQLSSRNYSVRLALTVSALNLYYLPELIDWRLQQSAQEHEGPSELFSDHPLHSPEFLSVQVFPVRIKNVIQERLINYLNGLNTSLPVTGLISGYVDFMNSEDKSHLFPKFLEYTRTLDKVRSQDMRDFMPDFAQLINL